jgi:hypothetical protein
MTYISAMKEVEKYKVTIYNVFPMRNDIVPKHIRIDTTSLVHLLITKKQGNKSDYLFNGNLKKNEDKIWAFFFRTERQCFIKPNYSFHHMIETDGISVSILLIRQDKIGKRILSKECKSASNEKYIDELSDDTYNIIKNKKIVSIDPGKCDILYCVDGDNKGANTFRYSQDQRRKETKVKKYNKLILNEKETKLVTGFNQQMPNLGPRLQKINPENLQLVKVYESVTELMNENKNIKRPSIMKAIQENTI